MSKRLLGWDGASHGMASWWHENGEADGWAVEYAQDCDALLDLNKEAQNHCDPYNAERDVRMVARIPLIIIAKWRAEYGIDYWSQDPDVQRRVDRLLSDPEWRWLRTDLGNASHVFLSPPEPLVVI